MVFAALQQSFIYHALVSVNPVLLLEQSLVLRGGHVFALLSSLLIPLHSFSAACLGHIWLHMPGRWQVASHMMCCTSD